MKVLLSIKPEHAIKIFSGVKKYEYRKQIFKEDVECVVVYASYPVQKIIGEFYIEKIMHDKIESLWEKTKKYSGVSYEYYCEYFSEKEKGYAIKVTKTKKFDEPLALHEVYYSCPPQSFAYIR